MKSFIGKPIAVLTDEQIEIKIADFLLDIDHQLIYTFMPLQVALVWTKIV